ncbi:MAG: polysaccharide deacetylase family protein [Rectinemataceae bacterium]|jgi:peptidoglycan/xylan/chitin deacetylase (PgdA/CDA1 family)
MPRGVRGLTIATILLSALAGLIGASTASALPVSESAKPFDFADRAFILCWHTFLGKKSLETDFALDELAGQLDELKALGYHFIGLDDALFGRIEGSRNLVATIDDGHRTIAWAYEKVFASRGIKPALLVYPAVIGASPYFLKIEALQALVASGCAVGSHGYYHLFVTEKLYKSDKAAFEKEIFTSKARVETITGMPSYFYAYPFGAFDQITKDEVARAGFEFALAVKPGFIFADPRLNDRYELPRTVVLRKGWAELVAFLARNAGSSTITGPEPQTWTESDEFPAPELWTGESKAR